MLLCLFVSTHTQFFLAETFLQVVSVVELEVQFSGVTLAVPPQNQTVPFLMTDTYDNQTFSILMMDTDDNQAFPILMTDTADNRTFPILMTDTDDNQTIPILMTDTDDNQTFPILMMDTHDNQTIHQNTWDWRASINWADTAQNIMHYTRSMYTFISDIPSAITQGVSTVFWNMFTFSQYLYSSVNYLINDSAFSRVVLAVYRLCTSVIAFYAAVSNLRRVRTAVINNLARSASQMWADIGNPNTTFHDIIMSAQQLGIEIKNTYIAFMIMITAGGSFCTDAKPLCDIIQQEFVNVEV